MNGRLRKRAVQALIIYFLMITAVSTPIAFLSGKSRGGNVFHTAAHADRGPSQNETTASTAEQPLFLAMAPNVGVSDSLEQAAATGEDTDDDAFGLRAPSLKPAALSDAVMSAIADGVSAPAGGAGNDGETPFNLALAPGASDGLIQGGAVPPGSGFPGAVIPGFLTITTAGPAPAPPPTGDNPPGDDAPTDNPPGESEPPTTNDPGDNPGGETPGIDEPPVLVTPVPAALPLMLTGFAGLFAAGKRRSP